ncbi:MAG: riboflavin synthase [Pseudomonadota bacterium]
MFTGIITDIGEVTEVEQRGDTRLVIATRYEDATIDLGASIACNGVCLTVTDKGPGWFAVDASAETLDKTTIGAWQIGTKVNLERSLRMGDELGGHFVFGHVDGVARVVDIMPDGDSLRWRFAVPEVLERYFAKKGSVALNGVSLTVNGIEDAVLSVNIIPHTQSETTFAMGGTDDGLVKVGDFVNLEIDMLARYVARLTDVKATAS